jgi:hypothetical protein
MSSGQGRPEEDARKPSGPGRNGLVGLVLAMALIDIDRLSLPNIQDRPSEPLRNKRRRLAIIAHRSLHAHAPASPSVSIFSSQISTVIKKPEKD